MLRRIVPNGMLILLLAVALTGCNKATIVRIRDLESDKVCTIKARVGQRVESEESKGIYAFTLRDDFGDMILGRTKKDISSVKFGVTYNLTGKRKPQPSSQYPMVFEVSDWGTTYGVPPWMIISPIVALVLALAVIWLYMRKPVKVPVIPEAWGYAEVISGPDRGASFGLKGEEIIVGRKQDPTTSISLVVDTHVSRRHGLISRDGNRLLYEDTGSTCGSWIDEEKVEPGKKMEIRTGGLLRIGPHSVVKVGIVGATDQDYEQEFTRTFDDADLPGDFAEAMTERESDSNNKT